MVVGCLLREVAGGVVCGGYIILHWAGFSAAKGQLNFPKKNTVNISTINSTWYELQLILNVSYGLISTFSHTIHSDLNFGPFNVAC